MWRAFATLSRCRLATPGPAGRLQPQPIAFADIAAYCKLHHFGEGEASAEFVFLLQEMDEEYLAAVAGRTVGQQALDGRIS